MTPDRRLRTALFALLCLAPAPGIATDVPAAEVAPSIDAYVRPLVEVGHLSGSLLVARGETILYERSFGQANLELGVPNSSTTRYCVASITKPMTLIVALHLMERGALQKEDPLTRWIPDFPRGDEITVAMLAGHQAGIPHRLTEPSDEVVPRTAADMVEIAKHTALEFPPGERTSYSSGGYSVLARVLELAAGKSYSELLAEHVFAPAGMTDSVHPAGHRLVSGRAASYQIATDGRLTNTPLKNYSFLVGAGSVFSTPRDLMRMLHAVSDGTYGDLARQTLVREGRISWNGVTNGFRAFADYSAADDTYVVFAGNVVTGALDILRQDLPRLVAGEAVEPPVPPRIEPVAVPLDVLRQYEGDYELRPGSPLALRLEGDEVRIGDWILVPTSDTTFFSPQDYGRIEVVSGADDSVERLDWTIGDTVYPMPRVSDPASD